MQHTNHSSFPQREREREVQVHQMWLDSFPSFPSFLPLSPSFAPLSSHSVQRWWALWPRGIEDRRQLPLSSTFSTCHRSFILPLFLTSPSNKQTKPKSKDMAMAKANVQPNVQPNSKLVNGTFLCGYLLLPFHNGSINVFVTCPSFCKRVRDSSQKAPDAQSIHCSNQSIPLSSSTIARLKRKSNRNKREKKSRTMAVIERNRERERDTDRA